MREVASAITHFIVGGALALPAVRAASIRRVLPAWAIPVTSGLLAVAPDLDTLPDMLLKRIEGGRYQSAAVGACPSDSKFGASSYRIAVLLFN